MTINERKCESQSKSNVKGIQKYLKNAKLLNNENEEKKGMKKHKEEEKKPFFLN